MNAASLAARMYSRGLILWLLLISLVSVPALLYAAEDDVGDLVTANAVVKVTPLAPLKKLVPVPLPDLAPNPNAASAVVPSAAEPSAPPVVDTGAGGMLTLPTLNAPVIDQAGALSSDDNQLISSKLRAIHDQGRAQIGLILVKSTQSEPIFDYATRVFTAWKLGEKKRDNGLLIVVAVQDRKIQILTGYGLEGIIPDVVASRIIREEITPQFKTGDYAGGLIAGINRIDTILQQDPETAKAAADQMRMQAAQGSDSGAFRGDGPFTWKTILLMIALIIIGEISELAIGRMISATGLAAAGFGLSMFFGFGLATAVVVGGFVFILLFFGLLQVLSFVSSMSSSGGGFGGSSGGGGFSGGGGGFGGGGASGSW